MRLALLFVFSVLSATAQTNSVAPTNQLEAVSNSPAETFQVKSSQTRTNQSPPIAQRFEKVRMEVIQNRRIICGKILKVLPEGIVVDSGYTNLMRAPLDQSWLIPGAVVASRATNYVETSQPNSVCVGLVFVTDLPKSRGAKPQVYDYVNLEGFPVGVRTYTAVGALQRTVREFTTKLQNAAMWNFEQSEQHIAPPK